MGVVCFEEVTSVTRKSVVVAESRILRNHCQLLSAGQPQRRATLDRHHLHISAPRLVMVCPVSLLEARYALDAPILTVLRRTNYAPSNSSSSCKPSSSAPATPTPPSSNGRATSSETAMRATSDTHLCSSTWPLAWVRPRSG